MKELGVVGGITVLAWITAYIFHHLDAGILASSAFLRVLPRLVEILAYLQTGIFIGFFIYHITKCFTGCDEEERKPHIIEK